MEGCISGGYEIRKKTNVVEFRTRKDREYDEYLSLLMGDSPKAIERVKKLERLHPDYLGTTCGGSIYNAPKLNGENK